MAFIVPHGYKRRDFIIPAGCECEDDLFIQSPDYDEWTDVKPRERVLFLSEKCYDLFYILQNIDMNLNQQQPIRLPVKQTLITIEMLKEIAKAVICYKKNYLKYDNFCEDIYASQAVISLLEVALNESHPNYQNLVNMLRDEMSYYRYLPIFMESVPLQYIFYSYNPFTGGTKHGYWDDLSKPSLSFEEIQKRMLQEVQHNMKRSDMNIYNTYCLFIPRHSIDNGTFEPVYSTLVISYNHEDNEDVKQLLRNILSFFENRDYEYNSNASLYDNRKIQIDLRIHFKDNIQDCFDEFEKKNEIIDLTNEDDDTLTIHPRRHRRRIYEIQDEDETKEEGTTLMDSKTNEDFPPRRRRRTNESERLLQNPGLRDLHSNTPIVNTTRSGRNVHGTGHYRPGDDSMHQGSQYK